MDTNPPGVAITAPVAGQGFSKPLATIQGTAGDNWRMSNVWCQLNSASWSAAVTTNGWTNWSTTFPLVAGTNKVRAFAVDAAGNDSATSSVSFYSTNAFLLQIEFCRGASAGEQRAEFEPAGVDGADGAHRVFNELAELDGADEFYGEQRGGRLSGRGGDECGKAVLSGGGAVAGAGGESSKHQHPSVQRNSKLQCRVQTFEAGRCPRYIVPPFFMVIHIWVVAGGISPGV